MEYNNGASNESNKNLRHYWPRITYEIENLGSSDFSSKNPELPLARIKKIMKLDDEVKMISAEAPIIFAKAAELFIQEVTIRAWLHTEENKRRTLQKNDITLAISKYDEFDFLIDIVPREEKKSTKKESHSPTSNFNTTANNTTATANSNDPAVSNVLTGITDQNAQNLLNAINCNGAQNGNNAQVLGQVGQTNPTNENVQYYFAMPGTGGQNNQLSTDQNQIPNTQQIQGLPNNISLQNLQSLQGLQGLQGAQIVLNSNGQPTLFVGNRDGC